MLFDYDSSLIKIIKKIYISFNIEDYELCPGVKVIATPGHTSEDVTVLVQTIKNEKKICIAITGICQLRQLSTHFSGNIKISISLKSILDIFVLLESYMIKK